VATEEKGLKDRAGSLIDNCFVQKLDFIKGEIKGGIKKMGGF